MRNLRAAVSVRTERRADRGMGAAAPGTRCLFLKVGLTFVAGFLCRLAAGGSPVRKLIGKLDRGSLLRGRALFGVLRASHMTC